MDHERHLSTSEDRYDLNPEGTPASVDSAYRMIDGLNAVHEGEHTNVGQAREYIVEASEMLTGLKSVTGAGPEIERAIVDLDAAINILKDAIKQVH